ncbi:MAG: DivIVA domain-containing protein [Mycoplasmataceae bacterium]|jgi:DivIVA domain-containing protein|nr:DivIVA domain-containing protein [Mycoplasmataceae bacterium]
MPNKLEVMMEEILNKKFGKRIHSGYDPEDVDAFFDYVISYLQDVNRDVSSLQNELKAKDGDVQKLKESLEQKNNTIATLNGQVEYYRANGYDYQRISSEMSSLRDIVNKKESEKKSK